MRSPFAFLAALCLAPTICSAQIITNPPSASGVTFSTVTCATTSTAFVVRGGSYLSVQVPPSAAGTVWFAWGEAATATLAPPSQGFLGGATLNWSGGTGACIVASGTQAISVGTR